MSMTLLAVLALAAAVVIAIFMVLWREHTSARESGIAVVSGVPGLCSPRLRRMG
jgi:hypothetical protein